MDRPHPPTRLTPRGTLKFPSRLLDRLSGLRPILGLACLLGLLAAAMAAVMANVDGPPLPDMPGSLFGYSAEQAHRALDVVGEGGRLRFAVFQLLDLAFFIPTYVLLLAASIHRAFRAPDGRPSGWSRLALLPVLAGAVDVVETTGLLALLVAYPRPLTGLVGVAGAATSAKWVLVGGSVLLALGGLGAEVARALRRATPCLNARPRGLPALTTVETPTGLANARALVGLGLIALVFTLAIFPWRTAHLRALSGVADPVPDLWFAYPPGDLADLAARLGEQGRRFYALSELSIDLAYPLLYGSFLSGLILRLIGRAAPAASRWRRLALLPFAVVACDYAENTSLAIILLGFPGTLAVAPLAALFTTGKWILGGICVAVILVAAAGWAARSAQRSRHATLPPPRR